MRWVLRGHPEMNTRYAPHRYSSLRRGEGRIANYDTFYTKQKMATLIVSPVHQLVQRSDNPLTFLQSVAK